MNKTLIDQFVMMAQQRSECPAIADSSGRNLKYRELLQQAQDMAACLQQMRPTERNLGVYLPSSVPAAVVNYGITLAGKVAVNINFTAGQANCRAAIELSGVRTIVSSRAFLNKLGADPLDEMIFLEDMPCTPTEQVCVPAIDPHSIACLLFSSGSTGTPKGIALTHWNILANAQGLASRIPPRPDDCVLGVLPFFHSFGYTFGLWFPVLQGIRAVYHGSPTDAKIIGDLAETHRATYFLSTPTFCYQYAQRIERQQFSTLKYILVGAEKLREFVAREFKDHFGIELLPGYGCTELGPGVAVNTPEESKPGSVGRPLEGIEVRIADPETLDPLPAGEVGMILVNGPSRMPGYYNSPELTEQVLHRGFYITGDLGYMDSDGFLYVSDRIARFSKVAGEMVPHLKIEEAVADLTPAFVTGLPDDRRGERLVLLYTNRDISAGNIFERLNKCDMPALWIPKKEDIYMVETIPVLASGKLDLKHARELADHVAKSPVEESAT
jgi:acyl-[acyl-carrier-protein]-phospholipid O-acyltransferase/long-chain-fatty-acid--[acyl-carrier-protein] ligase